MHADSAVTALAVQLVQDPEQLNVLTAQRALDLGVGAALRLLHLDRRPGESLEALFARLGSAKAAKLEADSMLLLDGISEASRHAILILMYHTLASGRWVHEAAKADLSSDFRAYIYWLLLNPDRPGGAEFKQREVSRWVESCLLAQQLYLQEGGRYPWRERLGVDDSLLPATAEEALALYGDRWGRGAYSLLSLTKQLNGRTMAYAGLKALIDEGKLDPNGETDAAHAWRLITQWRFLFGFMADLSHSQNAIDREAAGSRQRAIPPLVITQDLTPAQRAAFKKLSFVVFPDEAPEPLTEVRYLLELLPTCPSCEPMRLCSISPDLDGSTRFVCSHCGQALDGQSHTERWWVKWHTEGGMTEWRLADRPELDDWTPSTITIAGVRGMVYTTWQSQQAICDLEERYAADV